ncbi:hypothetical protein K1719_027830 [Acacia pycnantha]|nr:hypothetical protein K1719_027830 [Acacia pycnantha]
MMKLVTGRAIDVVAYNLQQEYVYYLREHHLRLPLLVSCANICGNMEERVGTRILAGAVLSDAGELHGLDVVRPSDRPPK